MWNTRSSAAFALACVIVLPAVAEAQEDGPAFFETNVRPVLARQCLACHSSPRGWAGCGWTAARSMLKGGTRGPAIVPGKPGESLMLRAVRQSEHAEDAAVRQAEGRGDCGAGRNGSRWARRGARRREHAPKRPRAEILGIRSAGGAAAPEVRNAAGQSRRSIASCWPRSKRRG